MTSLLNKLKFLELSFRRFFIRFLGKVTSRSSKDKNIPEKAKVLLLRQDRIGDLLVSTPIIHTLAKFKPHWQIDMLFGKSNINILKNDPVISRRWFYDKGVFNTIKLIRKLRKEKYDLVIDLMDNPSATSTAFLSLAGGRINVGLEKENGFAYDISVPMRSRKETHIVERLGDLLRALGCNIEDKELRLYYKPGEESQKHAKEFFSSFQKSGKKFCCVNISSGAPSRFWGVDLYRTFLFEAIAAFPDIIFFIAAQPRDTNAAKSICDGIKDVHLIPVSDSFDEFAAMVNKTDVLVTPDTAAVHLGSALGKSMVVLFTTQAMATNWAPYGVKYRSVVSQNDSLRSISPKQVIEALRDLMKN